MRIPLPESVVRWLERKADAHPKKYHSLYHEEDGSLYMERKWLRSMKGDRITVRIHVIHSRDYDNVPHDHPWRWHLTWILRGAYMEELTKVGGDRVMKWRKRGALVFRTAACKHRIVSGDLPATTLFITGRWVQVWGFYMLGTGTRVPWKQFTFGKTLAREREAPFIEPGSGLRMERGKFYILSDSGSAYTSIGFDSAVDALHWWSTEGIKEFNMGLADCEVADYYRGSIDMGAAANVVAADRLYDFWSAEEPNFLKEAQVS